MTGLALLFLGVSVSDLVAGGISGQHGRKSRTGVGIALGCLVSGALALWLRPGSGIWLWWTVLVAMTCLGWMLPRVGETVSAERARIAVAALFTGVGIAIILSGLWSDEMPHHVQRWMSDLAFPRLANLSPARLVLGICVVLFLSAPANGVVRSVLAIAGTEIADGEQRLRGGRFIGVIERYLIFGLAVANEPTAAALVVSAKSILRFPELSGKTRSREEETKEGAPVLEVDLVTEYFLLGSLTSWLLALAPVILLR